MLFSSVKFLPLLGLLAGFALPLPATELAAYRVGDMATTDIVTPVALDVEDTVATAALQATRARQIPAVFRSFPDATNVMVRAFLAAFEQARTNFQAELVAEFQAPTLDAATLASTDFDHLVTGFGVKYKNFPLPDELAAEWARGGDGQVIRDKLLTALQQAAAGRIGPNALPDGMVVGDTIRLVPVTSVDQKLSLDTVLQCPLASAASLTTLATAQAQFRRNFSAPHQSFARALAAFLQPNCLPDAPFMQLTRGTVAGQMIVASHFDAGDILVHRGDLIDAKAKAVLTALKEKLRSSSATVVAESPQPAHPPAAATLKPTPAAARIPTYNMPAPALKTGVRHKALIITLAGISTGALLVFFGQVSRKTKRTTGPSSAIQISPMILVADHAANANLAPEVTQAVREAVAQELASQRRELLLAHQAATEEIVALVHRLDELQVSSQERLHTYETRIQTLEKELAIRTEENRELLKLKIEMTRHQLETELAASAMTPITA